MPISVEEVRYIASLAKLKFSAEEEGKMAEEMGNILGYIRQLDTLDTSEVRPMTHVLDLVNVMREDRVAPRISHEQGLRTAPEAEDPYFTVPKVID